ncbi:transient receptor potential cation channel subfamily V member 5-like isoform X5 [Narcine bancroftii]|uniref:transient receptor potential cation channel subfamily V member 5-like isoform X5 n=1 Tax=Narcine bancroftii TaxID=1343680 RepID=UPI00383108E7
MVAPGIEALARGGRRMLRRMWGQRERETGVGELYLLQAKRIRENPLFLACKENDVGGIKKLLTSGTTDVFQRGALGETVLHVAVLHHNLESVVALLDAVPDLVNEPAASDVYRGETALHIAVLNQDTQIVREMLDRGADVRTPRVTGSYFKRSPENLAYFGEHVLSFAACCGNEEIIQLLIDGGADIAAVDSLGNTVLHILALQPNKTIACQMYDLIEGLEGTETVVRAGTVPNHDGLTPLKLAAIEGNLVMFDHLMKKQRLVCWELGPISHCLYNLQEIDSWQEDRSVLELVLSSKKTEALSILDLSPLVQLISLKWAGYGRFYFRLLTLFYLLYIIVFTLCCVFRPLKARVGNVTDSRDTTIYVQRTLQEAYGSSSDHVRLVGELISVLGAMVTLLLEIPDIMRFGVRQYFGKTALGGPFHVIIISHAGLVLLILVLRLTDTPGEVVAMSLALVLGWCNVMFFARGFAMLGPFTITIQKMIFGDLIRFCWLMFLVLLGFTAAVPGPPGHSHQLREVDSGHHQGSLRCIHGPRLPAHGQSAHRRHGGHALASGRQEGPAVESSGSRRGPTWGPRNCIVMPNISVPAILSPRRTLPGVGGKLSASQRQRREGRGGRHRSSMSETVLHQWGGGNQGSRGERPLSLNPRKQGRRERVRRGEGI